MTHVPDVVRAEVEQRAGGRCEYCKLSQVSQEARFHIDHVLPIKLGGSTRPENLCLACVSCSLRKSAKTRAIDPVSGVTVPLFHPRWHKWSAHFRWREVTLSGLTPIGRATVATLRLNRPLIVEIRREEALLGRHPS